jgi:hypothetical protein
MAFEEWAATMCIARENGILALQIGQSSKSDRGVRSFTMIESITATPDISKQICPLLIGGQKGRPGSHHQVAPN